MATAACGRSGASGRGQLAICGDAAATAGRWGARSNASRAPAPNIFHRAAAGGTAPCPSPGRASAASGRANLLRVRAAASWPTEVRVSESPGQRLGAGRRRRPGWQPPTSPGTPTIAAITTSCFRAWRDGRALAAASALTSSPNFQAHAAVAVDAQGRPWVAWNESGVELGQGPGLPDPPPLAMPLHQRAVDPPGDVGRRRPGRSSASSPSPRCPGMRAQRRASADRVRRPGHAGHGLPPLDPPQTTAPSAAPSPGRTTWRASTATRWSRAAAAARQRGLHREARGAWRATRDGDSLGGVDDRRPAVQHAGAGKRATSSARGWASRARGRVDSASALRAARGPVRRSDPDPRPRGRATWQRVRGYADRRRRQAPTTSTAATCTATPTCRRTSSTTARCSKLPLRHRRRRLRLHRAHRPPGAATTRSSPGGRTRSWWTSSSARRVHAALRLRAQPALSERPPQRDLRPARRAHAADSARGDAGRQTGAAKLYEYLRKNRGISMPHSSATDQGTDWRDNDPEVEPLIEIYQGYRNSYEYEGAPRAATALNPQAQKSGWQPRGLLVERAGEGLQAGRAGELGPLVHAHFVRLPGRRRRSPARAWWTPCAAARLRRHRQHRARFPRPTPAARRTSWATS